jgi:hypothetical protein
MSYLKIDDGFLDHPKFVRAERLAPGGAVHLWLGLMVFCKRHLTDGVVPVDMLDRVHGPARRWRRRALEALVDVGLVERDPDGGVRVHDYLEWNLSKAEIERRSADRKARRGGLERAGQQPSDAGGDRRVMHGATSKRSRGDARTDDIPVANDVAPLDALGREPVRARAHKTETETETEINPPVTPPPSALALSARTPSTAAPRARTPKASRAQTQCPKDFAPDDTTLATATSLGFSAKLELETRATFADYWRSVGKLKADWQATYRNWLRSDAKKLGLRPPQPDSPQRRLWAEQKRRAEAPPVQPVAGARETIQSAMMKLGRLHAS